MVLRHMNARKKTKLAIIIGFIILVALVTIIGLRKNIFRADVTKNIFQKRYVFYQENLNDAKQVERLQAIMVRAVAAGYNGIVLGDHGGQYNGDRGQTYKDNLALINLKAQELKLAIIPLHFNQTDSHWDNVVKKQIGFPEALPVKDAKFVVSGSQATIQMDPVVAYPNGGFENWRASNNNYPAELAVDQPGVIAFRDDIVKHSGNYSIRLENTQIHSRIYTPLIPVEPFRTYQFSIWLKTANFSAPSDIKTAVYAYDADGSNNRRIYENFQGNGMGSSSVANSQDWQEYKLTFDSLDKTRIRIYLDASTIATGQFWFDDAVLTEVGLENLIRRESLPVTVKSFDGSKTYEEGKDYAVAEQKLNLPVGSAISDGETLKVSYFRKGDVMGPYIADNACHEDFFNNFKTDAQRLNSLFPSASGYMIDYDEWRVANWDPACQDINNGQDMTGGEYMAYAQRRTEALIKEANPQAEIYVWDDMFDPYHNAVPIYYAVKGSVEGSWEGVSPETIIINWNAQWDIDTRTNESKQESSLKFWAGRGNHQILSGYYDGTGLVRETKYMDLLDQLEAEPGGIQGVDGYMYTTWKIGADGSKGKYQDLEAVADFFRAQGRWGSTPTPTLMPTATSTPTPTPTPSPTPVTAPTTQPTPGPVQVSPPVKSSPAATTPFTSDTTTTKTKTKTKTKTTTLNRLKNAWNNLKNRLKPQTKGFSEPKWNQNSPVRIPKFNFNARGIDNANLNGESVILRNNSAATINFLNWRMENARGEKYILPDYNLNPGQSVFLHTGQKWQYQVKHLKFWQPSATPIYVSGNHIYMGQAQEFWNNYHDTLLIYNSQNQLIYMRSY